MTRLATRLRRRLGRRLQLLLTMAVVAAALGAVTASGASFVTTSSTTAQASAAALGSDSLMAHAGNGQSAVAGTAVATPPSVVIVDGGGNPVRGLTVTFSVQSGGGTITGASAVTDDDGVAAVGNWTLGATPGTNTLRATCAGVSGSPLTITATGTSGPAVRIVLYAGDGQTAVAGSSVSTAPAVRVTDAGGNPVVNVDITFAVTGGGGSVTGGNARTNASGIASVNRWTLGATAGANTLTATSAGLTGSPVTFTASGIAGAASRITTNGGNGQTVHVGTPVTVPPSVLVTDANNNPVGGVAVTFAVASGGGTLTGGGATTNAAGVAAAGSWTLGTAAGTNTLTATSLGLTGSPVTFTAAGTAGAPSKYVVSSGSYSPPVSSSVIITAQLADQYDNPVETPGVAVTFSKTPTTSGTLSGATPTTDASGQATVTLTVGTTVGTAYTVTAASTGPSRTGATPAITAIAGVPTTISLNAGNNQSATVNTNVATAPSVRVTDVYGNPVSGVAVTFAVASGGGTVVGGGATTNAAGIAAVTSWTLGTKAGANTLTATSAGLAGTPVTFTATGLAGPATKYVVTASNYNPLAGAAVTITAQLADRYDNPVATAGIRVRFTKTGNGGYFTATRVNTNASGIATTTLFTSTRVGRVHTVIARSTNPTARTGTSAPITTH